MFFMTNSSIIIDLNNPKTGLVAEALSNKTCVKILSLLAEQELTATDVANRLDVPLNTVGYNLEKLMICGLIEKSSNFFWSVKGKKTPVYKVSNKRIVISHKKSVRGIVPAVIASGLFALVLKGVYTAQNKVISANKIVSEGSDAVLVAASSAPIVSNIFNLGWIWFIVGALFSLLIASLWDFVYLRRSLNEK